MKAVKIENLLGPVSLLNVVKNLASSGITFTYEHAGIWPGEPTFVMAHPVYGSGGALSPLYLFTQAVAAAAMDHMEWAPNRDMIEAQYLDQIAPRSDRAWYDHRWGGSNISLYMVNTTGAKIEIYDQTIHDNVKDPLTVAETHDCVANTWITIPSARRFSIIADPGTTWTSILTSVLNSHEIIPQGDK